MQALWWWSGLAVLCAFGMWLRWQLIAARGPYPMYGDEEFLSKTAWRLLTEHTLKPGFYRYGSLPIYLAACAMKLAASVLVHTGELRSLSDVGSVGFPFYTHRAIVWWPRLLFALFGVLGAAGGGVAAARAYQRPVLIWLAPVSLACSSWYLNLSWTYLNVDIVLAALVVFASAYLSYTHRRDAWLHRVWLPGAICGAVIATKYNGVVVLVPFALACLRPTGYARSAGMIAALVGVTLVSFAACEPYSVLDYTQFFADVKFELEHYSVGHLGHEAAPGSAQLAFYVGEIRKDYGLGMCLLGALGVVTGLVARPRVTLLLISLPVALLTLMCANRVHFTRAVLPVIAMLSMFIAVGVVWTADRAIDLLTLALRRSSRRDRFTWPIRLTGWVCAFATFLSLAPIARILRQSEIVPDSRVVASAWLRSHAGTSCTLLIPDKLGFDLRSLPAQCRLHVLGRLDRELQPAIADAVSRLPAQRLLFINAQWSADRRRAAGAAVAERWNNVLSGVPSADLLFSTGNVPVWVNYPSIEGGNPALSIYEIQH
jgi:hypothetical protein